MLKPRAVATLALLPALWAVVLAACSSQPPDDAGPGRQPVLRTERDQWGLITCSPADTDKTCFTHRAIAGVSMGASGAGQLAFSHPELFDSVAMMGIPLLDWVYMLRNFKRSYLGGFCDMQTILANLDQVADPSGPAFCGPAPSVVRIEPTGRMLEPEQDFNHWYRWIDEGRGGSFGRKKLRESFQDISHAFGNAHYYNPESPYYPPGVPSDYRMRADPSRCETPVVIRGLKHKEFNPDGTYPVIPVCDTNTNEGEFDPSRPNEQSFEMLLAVDYNDNGRRDYAEPVITMLHERFEDAGAGENDTHDWMTNPTGKRGNWIWDAGEPFEDTGIDGVPNTNDHGEGNGKFDYSPNVERYFALNPRMLVEKMDEGHLDRLHIYADAGIRDFLMSAAGTNWFWGALQARVGKEKARDYTSFNSLVGGAKAYDFLAVDYSPEKLGRHAYVRYGNPDASEREIGRGDGHHVGSPDQVLHRFFTALSFIQSRFQERDVTAVEEAIQVDALIQKKSFHSTALDEDRPFGIILPPGYTAAENAEKRYPVAYVMHGQGQESDDLLAAGIFFFTYMAQSNVEDTQRRFQSDWAKFIIVFPDSRCYRDECGGGNFNTNHPGLDGNGPRFMDSLFELMVHVESTYRVAQPIEVPLE